MKKTAYSTVLVFFIFISCGQWKVTTLNPKRFAFIKNGTAPGQVLIKMDEFGFEDLSVGVGVFDGKILSADNVLKRVQLLNSDGEAELVIGSIKNLDPKKVKAINFNFNNIGAIAMDDENNIYVQNRLNQAGAGARGGKADADSSPSYVLGFNRKGDLQYTLGQSGTPDTPFYQIESMTVDKKDRLFVVSRSYEMWNVYRFSGKKRNFYLAIGNQDFQEKDGKEVYRGRIENIMPYESGDTILITVAFYHELRLKYIKVYNYLVEERKLDKAILNIPDPKNVLFNFVNDKYLYFWNMTNNNVKFVICNMDGNIINNLQLNMKDKKSYYTKIFGDRSGRIFSYHVGRKGVEIIRWD